MTDVAGSLGLIVRIGEIEVARFTGVLMALGLGSCVGVALYDPSTRVAGLAHVFLPSSPNGHLQGEPPARFADTGVDALVRRMEEAGAVRRRLVARIAGGAQLFLRSEGAGLDVGRRNVQAVREALARLAIPIAGEDVGGHRGRSIRLFVETGRVLVSTLGLGAREI
ncbi:MAG: chemotaxis protein CheD [Limnochordaceae bacterium]|nr:chemotaxis protein CheD [Limnochordaceae bacterium]